MARSPRGNVLHLQNQVKRGIDLLHSHDISVSDVIVHFGSNGVEYLRAGAKLTLLKRALLKPTDASSGGLCRTRRAVI
jgi:hypothetical protein